METYNIKQEFTDKGGETILNNREYILNNENNVYLLRLEINETHINIIVSLNDNIEYNYKTKMSLSEIVNKLELNPTKFSNLELILNIFDEIYNNKKIFININNDVSCELKIKFINVIKESIYEFKLLKNYTKINDKFNILYNEIKLLRNDNDNKIKALRNKIDEKEKEMKEVINMKDNLINEMNNKIMNQEIKIEELEKIIRKNKELEQKNEEKLMKINNINIKDINNKDNNIINDYNIMIEKINKLNNKIIEHEKIINKNNSNINNILKNISVNKDDEYEKKINYKFIKEPKNLEFKEDIITNNICWGWNDIFEVFISFQDNKEYLVSQNEKNYNIDIYGLIDNQLIKSLKGHKNKINSLRYFINDKNKNEYLVSGSSDKRVIIWDISNNYKLKYSINTKYGHDIYSCLLIFPNNTYNNYIVTSSFNKSDNDENSATKIYLLNDEYKFIKYINKTNTKRIYYLLSWYNKKNNKYYIIQFTEGEIMINNLLEDELYSELIHEPEADHYYGFIYNEENNDYLCSSSRNGFINIWDLFNKNIFKIIKVDVNGIFSFHKNFLTHIIEWNKKYFITTDYKKKLIIIIDIKNELITDIKTTHEDQLRSIKKIKHPIYGESLLSAADDKTIKLWTIE